MSTSTSRHSQIAHRGRTGLIAVLAAFALVATLDWATYAATGTSLVLGRSNSANATTTVSRTTSGPVMALKAHSSKDAPFSTNGTGKVKNLNADRIDGLDSKAFARAGALASTRSTAKKALARSAVAAGFVDNFYTNPYFAGEFGFESVTFDPTYNRYRLKLTGRNYHFSKYVAAVTPSCPVGKQAMVSVTDADGMIDVWLRDAQGAFVKCSFTVTVFKIAP